MHCNRSDGLRCCRNDSSSPVHPRLDGAAGPRRMHFDRSQRGRRTLHWQRRSDYIPGFVVRTEFAERRGGCHSESRLPLRRAEGSGTAAERASRSAQSRTGGDVVDASAAAATDQGESRRVQCRRATIHHLGDVDHGCSREDRRSRSCCPSIGCVEVVIEEYGAELGLPSGRRRSADDDDPVDTTRGGRGGRSSGHALNSRP